jgi:Bacterial protein of unknown function (DUF885)
MSATEELYRSYLDLRWNFDPSAATAAGVTTEDHRLGQFDASSMRTHLAAFRSIAGAAEQLEVDDPNEEIDRTAFLDEVRITIFRFELEKPHVHNPAFWLSHLFEAVYGLLRHREGPPAHRARAVVARLRATPAFLAAALETLKDPPQVFLDTAAAMIAGGGRLFEEAAGLFGGALPEAAGVLDTAAKEAEAALTRFGLALTTTLQAHPDDLSFAIGEEEFNRRLHHEHALQAGAPELYRYGLHLVEEVDAEVAALARRIDARAGWRDVVQRLRATAPAEDPLSGYRENMDRSRRFVVERSLATIPDGPLEVVPTPVFLRPLIPFAAYHPPGPFASERTGLFYVTSPDNSTAHAPDARLCTHELAATSLHEGYPGHHLQMLTAQGLETQVRRNLWTPVTVEGWALYCEEMMAEEGFFESPEELLFQRVHLLWRAVRIVLDVGLHTRGMTPDQATELLADRLAMDRRRAAAEVSRYCAWPSYQLCYAVGRREILHLRDAYRERAGAEFSLRQFHDDFLGYGGLPVSLIRWGMGLGIEE